MKVRAEMTSQFKDGVLVGKLVDYGSIDSYQTVFEPGAFDAYLGTEKEFNLDYRHDLYDVLAKFKVMGREDGIYIEAKPKDNASYERMKDAVNKGAGLSVTFEPVKASEVDGIAYYKECKLVGGALTPNPSNKNAVVTYFREEKEKEDKDMTFEAKLIKDLYEANETIARLEAAAKTRSAEPSEDAKLFSEFAKEIVKQRESEKILGFEAMKVTPEAKDFLKTREAEALYMSASISKDPKATWGEVLKERGISGLPAPSGILKRVADAVNDEGSVLPFIRHENLPTLVVGGDKLLDIAKGHTPGNNKVESNIELETRVLTPQYVYKYIKLPKLVMNSNASDLAGALLTYVMNRLPDMVVMAVNRAIITGGVTGVSATQIYPVIGDTWANEVTGTTGIVELLEKLSVSTPKAVGGSTLVIHRNDLAKVRFMKDKNDNYVFPVGVSNQVIATHFGFKNLVQSVAVDEKTAVSLNGYVTNGSRGMEFDKGTILVENNNEYLFEMPISGSLEYKGTAAYGTYDDTPAEG